MSILLLYLIWLRTCGPLFFFVSIVTFCSIISYYQLRRLLVLLSNVFYSIFFCPFPTFIAHFLSPTFYRPLFTAYFWSPTFHIATTRVAPQYWLPSLWCTCVHLFLHLLGYVLNYQYVLKVLSHNRPIKCTFVRDYTLQRDASPSLWKSPRAALILPGRVDLDSHLPKVYFLAGESNHLSMTALWRSMKGNKCTVFASSSSAIRNFPPIAPCLIMSHSMVTLL